MAAEFTPFAQALKTRNPGLSSSGSIGGHDTSHFTPIAHETSPRTGDTAIISAVQAQHRAVNVELKRDGERISQIRIQCRCGELIEIDCEY